MNSRLLILSRRIRHTLDAWLLLPAALAASSPPYFGVPFGMGLSLLGVAASFRLLTRGMLLQGGALVIAFLSWTIFLPISRTRASEPLASPIDQKLSSEKPTEFLKPESLDAASKTHESIAPPLVREEPVYLSRQSSPIPDLASAPQPPHSNGVLDAEGALAVVEKWWGFRKTGDSKGVIALYASSIDTGSGRKARSAFAGELKEAWAKQCNIPEALSWHPTARGENGSWIVEHQVSFETKSGRSGSIVRSQRYRRFVLQEVGQQLLITGQSTDLMPIVRDARAKMGGVFTGDAWAVVTTCVESDLVGDLDSSMRSYSDNVSYFGSKKTKEEVRADKERYLVRWPVRRERFQGEFSLKQNSGRLTASFQSQFRTESKERGEWCEGTVAHEFQLTSEDGKLRIVSQSGKVAESRKGRL